MRAPDLAEVAVVFMVLNMMVVEMSRVQDMVAVLEALGVVYCSKQIGEVLRNVL